MNTTVPDPSVSTATGLPPESEALLTDDSAMDEMKKAFEQIEALKQGEIPEEEDKEASVVEEGDEHPSEDTEPLDKVEDKPEETSQEQSAESSPVEDDKKKKTKQPLWDLKREKYALLEEKEALSQENQRLKEMLDESVYRGTYHYGKSAYGELDKAIESKKKAFEEGDTDALIKADIALIKAQRAVDDLESWMEEEKRKTPEQEGEKPLAPETPAAVKLSPVQAAMAQDWLQEHPDLNPSSPSYALEKARTVAGFIEHLDGYIAQNNLQNTLYSETYFKTVNDFIADMERSTPTTTPPVPTPSPSVAGVRNSHGTSTPDKQKLTVVLTSDEKRMARNAGVSEKEWLKYKIEDMRRR